MSFIIIDLNVFNMFLLLIYHDKKKDELFLFHVFSKMLIFMLFLLNFKFKNLFIGIFQKKQNYL